MQDSQEYRAGYDKGFGDGERAGRMDERDFIAKFLQFLAEDSHDMTEAETALLTSVAAMIADDAHMDFSNSK